MADGSSFGIRADDGFQKPRLVLKADNYRWWAMVMEQLLIKEKVWTHVSGTAVIPGPILILGAGHVAAIPAVPAIIAAMGVAAVAAVAAVPAVPGATQAQVDLSRIASEKYVVEEAKANSMIIMTLDQKDVLTLLSYPTSAAKWVKLAADHVSFSTGQAVSANTRFQAFAFDAGETVHRLRQRFDGLVTECTLQGLTLTELTKSTVLLTRPSEIWRGVIDTISIQVPLPTTEVIFQQMISLQERWDVRNEAEHTEVNYANQRGRQSGQRQSSGGGSSRGSANNRNKIQDSKQRTFGALQPGSANPCFACGSTIHLIKNCPKKDMSCHTCGRRGHLANMCRQEERQPEVQKALTDKPRGLAKKVTFDRGTKRESAMKSASETFTAEVVTPEECLRTEINSTEWLADSGSTRHICNDLCMFWDVRDLETPVIVRQLVGQIEVKQSGTVKIECENEAGEIVIIDLENTLFVPDLRVNLLSIQQMRISEARLVYPVKLGTIWILNSEGQSIGSMMESEIGRPTVNCRTLIPDFDTPLSCLSELAGSGASSVAVSPGDAYVAVCGSTFCPSVHSSVVGSTEATADVSGPSLEEEALSTITIDLLHRRTGHAAITTLHRLTGGDMVRGLEGGVTGDLGVCRGCMLGKPMAKPHRSKDKMYRAERPLELVHADLAGPIKPASWGGAKYLFVLTDDFSRKSWVILIPAKSLTEMRLKQWVVLAERECGHSLGRLRTDNGGEFVKQSLKDWLASRGVKQEFTPPRTPQSNGVAERMNRTLQDKARSMMAQSGLRGGAWGEVFLCASHLRNRGPVSNQLLTPQELWSGKKPTLSYLRSFGCKVYCPIQKGMRGGKLGEVRKEGVLIGYSDESPSYRVWDPVKGKVLNVGGAEFDEEVGPGWWRTQGEIGATVKDEREDVEFPDLSTSADAEDQNAPEVEDAPPPPPSPPPLPSNSEEDGELPELYEDSSDDEGDDDAQPMRFRPRSTRSTRGVPAQRYDEIFAAAIDVTCPATVQEALGGEKAELWAAAMDSELESLWSNNVYMEVDRPTGKVIGSRWVLRVKTDAEGRIDKYKARVVAKGYRQMEGVDYEETFAPTVRFESIRALLAMGVAEGWKFDQMDVSTAFLYAELEEETYVEIPEGISGVAGKVWKLLKCLYGLKQSPRMWNQTIDKVLAEIGFVRLKTDHGVYVFGTGDGRVFIALYVDDLLIMWKSMPVLKQVKEQLQKRFKMKDLGTAIFLLGIELRRTANGDLLLVQEKYAKEVVSKFGLVDCKPVSTPFEAGFVLDAEACPQSPMEIERMAGVPYRSLIGSLMYLAVCTRPDLAMGVSTLSSFCQNPGMEHWEAAKRLLRYVKGTAGDGLMFRRGEDVPLWGYSDASYGMDVMTKRGRSGFVMMSGGAAISWGSKLQEVVALSSTEAEYMALTYTAQEAMYLQQLQVEMGVPHGGQGVLLLCDNQSAIKIAQNPVFHKRSKHIAIRFHYIRERVDSGDIELQFVGTKDMAADQLTKHVGVSVLSVGKLLMGMSSD